MPFPFGVRNTAGAVACRGGKPALRLGVPPHELSCPTVRRDRKHTYLKSNLHGHNTNPHQRKTAGTRLEPCSPALAHSESRSARGWIPHGKDSACLKLLLEHLFHPHHQLAANPVQLLGLLLHLRRHVFGWWHGGVCEELVGGVGERGRSTRRGRKQRGNTLYTGTASVQQCLVLSSFNSFRDSRSDVPTSKEEHTRQRRRPAPSSGSHPRHQRQP